MANLKIGILGKNGRMGQTLMDVVANTSGVQLSGGIGRNENAEELIKNSDALIDFTSVESSLEFAKLTAKHKKIHVIGTTGFTAQQFEELKSHGKQTRIFWSSNTSIGVNILFKLTQQVAQMLDDSYDIEIFEMHHKHKKDAPSGTALTLGEYAAKGRGVDFKTNSTRARNGITGERERGTIGFASLRGGNVIGDHTVIFAGENDRIELTHKSSSRDIYAKGAIKAALWCAGQPNGFYGMDDLLGKFD